jgi:GntR family transcriptional regulator
MGMLDIGPSHHILFPTEDSAPTFREPHLSPILSFQRVTRGKCLKDLSSLEHLLTFRLFGATITQTNNATLAQSNNGEQLKSLSGRIHLDFRSDEPIFQQIVRQIEALVIGGTFKPGDQLPTVRELAVDLRINFSTVARAYRILDEQRLISTQRGRGTYIEDPEAPGRDQAPEDKASDWPDEKLEEMAQRFIRQATQSGVSPEQVERAFQRQLEAWKRDHPIESGNSNGGS